MGVGEAHSETTNPSEEQATMDQVHGSTELMSHPAITPFSSRTRLFTAISAATAKPHQHPTYHTPHPFLEPNPKPSKPTHCTFVVETLGRERRVRRRHPTASSS